MKSPGTSKLVINALLLAGGYGTRLRPITITKPKCMVEVGGKPILENWLRKLEGIGCKTAIVNTHYLADQVEGYIKKRSGLTDMSIILSHEEDLLGTGGALVKHRELLGVDVGMAVHVDNATTLDLSELISRHYERPKHCIMTMQTFTTKSPSQCGIVETTDEGLVTAFHEKVEDPPGDCANGAVYVFDKRIFSQIDSMKGPTEDISKNIIPNLIGKIYTYHTREPFIDVGTIEALEDARALWPNSIE